MAPFGPLTVSGDAFSLSLQVALPYLLLPFCSVNNNRKCTNCVGEELLLLRFTTSYYGYIVSGR